MGASCRSNDLQGAAVIDKEQLGEKKDSARQNLPLLLLLLLCSALLMWVVCKVLNRFVSVVVLRLAYIHE
jgi:hypothetical protein